MQTDFDFQFEAATLGNRQATILHKYHLGNDVYHVCIVDSNDYYHSGYYRLDRKWWTVTYIGESKEALRAAQVEFEVR